jgi:hypothetical protein
MSRLGAYHQTRYSAMASYPVNQAGIAHARRLIVARQYVLRSERGEVQPTAGTENTGAPARGGERRHVAEQASHLLARSGGVVIRTT